MPQAINIPGPSVCPSVQMENPLYIRYWKRVKCVQFALIKNETHYFDCGLKSASEGGWGMGGNELRQPNDFRWKSEKSAIEKSFKRCLMGYGLRCALAQLISCRYICILKVGSVPN